MRYIAAVVFAIATVAAPAAVADDSALLFPNSDFEQGDLTNWTAKDAAFEFQPVTGDGPNVRRKNVETRPQGSYWVGTYEKYQGKPDQKPGDIQGNAPQGELLSTGFIIEKPFIGFLIAGGMTDKTEVQLIVNGASVRSALGVSDSLLRQVFWDVTEFKGEKGAIYICDHGKEPWDIICADSFRAYDAAPDLRLFPNSDFEAGTMENWTAEGDAFAGMPVKGDTVSKWAKRHDRSGHAGEYWVGSYENPVEGGETALRSADRDNRKGTLRSIEFEIKCPTIGFLAGGGSNPELAVRILVEGAKAAEVRGGKKECMGPVIWNLKDYVGKKAIIEIVDNAGGAWGHINADDFRYLRLD